MRDMCRNETFPLNNYLFRERYPQICPSKRRDSYNVQDAVTIYRVQTQYCPQKCPTRLDKPIERSISNTITPLYQTNADASTFHNFYRNAVRFAADQDRDNIVPQGSSSRDLRQIERTDQI